jgi:DNA helicase II / ATP-dependent DNA helicase PcrA
VTTPVETDPAWAVGLNAEQRRAVDHDAGPLRIIAGAGTGKTRTLVSRLARLLGDGVPPERILLVTFSRRAASELVRRTGHLVEPKLARRVEAGTFHSVAHRILRRYRASLGLPEGFTVMDQGDARDLFALLRAPVAADRRRRFPQTSTVAAVYSRVVSSQVSVETTVARVFPWCSEDVDGLKVIFTGYTDRKRAQQLLDFDDLLLYWRAAVVDPEVGPVMGSMFDHVLVDEYQDTSLVQAQVLRALRSADSRLTVVGDDAQAIYSFRAASVRNILDFPSHFPGATTITLEQNYRSSGPILDLANAVMAEATEGHRKRLWTDQGGGVRPILATCEDQQCQAEAVCASILEHYESGTALKRQVVLFRTSHHSDLVEIELGRRGVPFVKYGGLRFLEALHIRDLLAGLRLVENPWDELAWLRLLQLADGVGPKSAEQMMQHLGVWDAGFTGPSPLDKFCADPTGRRPNHRSAIDLERVAAGLSRCRDESLPAGVRVELLRGVLEPMIRRNYDHPEARLADFDALAGMASDYGSVDAFLADLTLDPPSSTGDLAGRPSLDDDWLTLSTVHSAKGGEWDVVHLIHAADGAFPSDMATGSDEGVDEERRLFYVALTRAKSHLHIYAPLRYHHGDPAGWTDRHSYAQRTRFLPPDLDGLMELRAVRSRFDHPMPVASLPVTTAVDVGLGGLW